MIAGLAAIAVPIGDQGAIAVLWLAGNPVATTAVVARLTAAATEVCRRLGLP